MAIGAMTKDAAQSGGSSPGPLFVDTVSFAGDTSYPTGGMDIETPFKALVKAGREILAVVPAGPNGGYLAHFDKATGKVVVYTSNGAGPAALAQVPNATALNGVTFVFLVISR